MAVLPLIFVALPTISALHHQGLGDQRAGSTPGSGCPCSTCSSSRRSCPPPCRPTRWSASGSRAPSSLCSSPRSAGRSSWSARLWPSSFRLLRSPTRSSGSSSPRRPCSPGPASPRRSSSGSHLLVQLLFTPLLACWSIWVGIAISARSADVRVAQQLGVFASLPPLAIVALITLNVISPSTGLALGLAAALLVLDGLGWRAVAAMFDRERLVTGGRT